MLQKIYTLHITEQSRQLILQALGQYKPVGDLADDTIATLTGDVAELQPSGVVES